MLFYSREELLTLCVSNNNVITFPLPSPTGLYVPTKRLRKRGRKGGTRARTRRRGHNVPLPSIIIANCQSINNKSDELLARTRFISEYRNCCAICYIETWLKPETPDSEIEPTGFKVFRGDRTPDSGKTKGGGLCIFINTSWCTNSTLKKHLCTPNLEVLVVSSRPFYLPREIPCIIFIR